jgi:ATP-dependent exoDNAse (exonuclease V) alpha subunit
MDSFNKVIELLKSENIFLTGGAGVGKSFLIKQITTYYKAECKNVVVLGSTGISAVNVGGQTIHSFFSFGISSNFEELNKSDKYAKSRLKELGKLLKNLHLLVIDEISMVSADLMDMILYRLRNGGFRGKLMIVGDFYQLSPVIKNKSENLLSDNVYAFESSAWDYFDFVSVELTKIKRTTDAEFMAILNKIRKGKLDPEVLSYLNALRESDLDSSEATILFGRNKEADELNHLKVSQATGEPIIREAIVEKKDDKLDDKALNAWKNRLPSIEKLTLKEGVPVIFTTNRWGFYHNGERAIVEHIDDEAIIVEKDGRLVKVERFEFELTRSVVDSKGEVGEEVICSYSQFPLRLAYAITIHKSQGMSIDNLICNVDNIFADSQFYVALSRATNPKKLKINFSRDGFENYLSRVIRVSPKVDEFYEKLKNRVEIE